ncbi:unnamed protein product [Phytophthora lilii]|uniref:Unnamed protein product n=1 Tax=Phytophthora lilii TaxID=2077276 RepID=A0A9W6UEC0_9STRA|nr:unnamed protein product [Phytophthora lilii]
MHSLLGASPPPSAAVWPTSARLHESWKPASDAADSSYTTATTASDASSEMELEGEYMLTHPQAMRARLHTPRSRLYGLGAMTPTSSMAMSAALASYEQFLQHDQPYRNRNTSPSSSSGSSSPETYDAHLISPVESDAVSRSYADKNSSLQQDPRDADTKSETHSPERDDTMETPVVEKNSRYLREIDRRAILLRIANGEKQSELAKEYQVSRAAICNLNKHRDEVFARKDGNPMAKHPKKPRPKTPKPVVAGMPSSMKWGSSGNSKYTHILGSAGGSNVERNKLGVHELKSRAVALLLTTLRQKFTTPIKFRRVCERLMRLLMEEALAIVPIRRVDIVLYDQHRESGVVTEHPPCAISMEQEGCPMLELFHIMEPEQPTGYICFDSETKTGSATSDKGTSRLSLFDAHLPASLSYHNVFLLAHVASSGDHLCAAVRCVHDRGASKNMVYVVSLVASAAAVQHLRAQHPDVKLISAQIVSDGDEDDAQPSTAAGQPSQTSLMRLRLEQAYETTPR